MTPHNHTPRPEIENFMNQEEWVDGTLQEAEEQVLSTPNEQIPVAQRKQQKSVREETLSAEEIMKEFILLQKKSKIGLTPTTEGNQPVIIDFRDLEDFTSAGASVPRTLPTTSHSREPLEIIQSTCTSSSDDQNIFSKFLEIK